MQRRTLFGSVAAAALMGAVSLEAQAKVKNPLPKAKESPKRRVLVQSSSKYHNSG